MRLPYNCAAQLAIVLGGIEVAVRFRDESVVIDLPKFVAADPNFDFQFRWSVLVPVSVQ